MKSVEKDFSYKEVILAKLSFYTCIREHADTREARNSFLDFIRKHVNSIDILQRRIAARLIRRMAEAYKGKSKEEGELESEAEKYLLG